MRSAIIALSSFVLILFGVVHARSSPVRGLSTSEQTVYCGGDPLGCVETVLLTPCPHQGYGCGGTSCFVFNEVATCPIANAGYSFQTGYGRACTSGQGYFECPPRATRCSFFSTCGGCLILNGILVCSQTGDPTYDDLIEYYPRRYGCFEY